MAAAVAVSTEALQFLNEALKGLDVAEVVKVDDNLAERDYRLKAKEHLLQMVQHFNGKIDEQQELSKPIMNGVCDAPGEFVKGNYDLNYLTQMADELGVKITEFKKKQGMHAAEVVKVDHNLAEIGYKLKTKKRSQRRFQNLNQMIHEHQVLSKLIMNEVCNAPGEFVTDNDDLNYLKEVVAKLEDKITELKKKQGDESFTDQ